MSDGLLIEMIEELKNYRSSMDFTALLGAGHKKLEDVKNLERIINQAKQELALIQGTNQ